MTTILEGKPWKFEQLDGARRILVLSGWAAPFGGPRVEAVVRSPVKARTERVYYPGSSNTTRHVFGVHFPNWEIKGRFRDRGKPPMGGPGFAKAKTEEVDSFVRDLQPVSISWGDVLYAQRAFLAEFDPGWEGEHEVEWVLRIEIDTKDTENNANVTLTRYPEPDVFIDAIIRAANVATTAALEPDMPGDILDALETLVDNVTGAVGQVLTAAEQVQSFKDATFAQLNRLQASIATLARAGMVLRETFVAIPLDALTFTDNADASIALLASQVTVEEQMLAMLDESTKMDRAAELAKAGRARGSCLARTGDTWEGISTQTYGRPDRAADIRELNNIDPGAAPVAGVEYLLPK